MPSAPFGGIVPPHFGASLAVSTDGTRVALYVGAAHVLTLLP